MESASVGTGVDPGLDLVLSAKSEDIHGSLS